MKYLMLLLVVIIGINLNAGEFLGIDKAAHFSSSLLITVWSNGYGGEIFKLDKGERIFLGLGISLGCGIGKEANDLWLKRTKWSWYDLFWDAAGISAALILINNDLIL